jgi:hypothetical protein
MPLPHTSLSLTKRLAELANHAHHEFVDVSDYVWKSHRLIDHEKELELSKLDAYFPNQPDYQKSRWELESNKFENTFPYLISVGNLFSVLSLFESYLLLLASELELDAKVSLSATSGQGVTKLFKFMKSLGVDFEQIALYEQIQAAIRIRNCFAHASGMLSKSRESHELRRLQVTGSYLSREHRIRRIELCREFDEIRITSSYLGDRLRLDNQYCHVLCSYLQTFFVELCDVADLTLSSSSSK